MEPMVPDWVIVTLFLSIFISVIGGLGYLLISRMVKKFRKPKKLLGNPDPSAERTVYRWNGKIYG